MQSDIDPLWALSEDFTVAEAAALIVGIDPGFFDLCKNDTNFDSNYPGLRAARTAIVNAINAKRLRATLRHDAAERSIDEIEDIFEHAYGGYGYKMSTDLENVGYQICDTPNWRTSTIAIDDLREWLVRRNWRPAFFFSDAMESPASAGTPGYLDPKHPRYASKLAAAVLAWQAVTDAGKRSPKAALTKWLTDHADDFGLSANGIEESAKVANWATIGGPPRS